MSKTPTPLSELFATLKGYVNQLSAGERTPGEVGSALNDWARDSAESIKAKIHEEVEASVAKMGFVKREEFDALQKRLDKLESELRPSSKKKAGESEKKKEKKSEKKSSARTTIKKSAASKKEKVAKG
jgi:BMFP domain-containing protein YqiC